MSEPRAQEGWVLTGLSRDAVTGALLVCLGVAGAVVGRRYGVGSVSSVGPGFFPVVISGGLIVSGAALLVRALLAGGARLEISGVRACAAVTASVLIFATLIERGGLIAAATAAILVAGIGTGASRPREALLFGVVVSVGIALLFIWVLRQPLNLGPRL